MIAVIDQYPTVYIPGKPVQKSEDFVSFFISHYIRLGSTPMIGLFSASSADATAPGTSSVLLYMSSKPIPSIFLIFFPWMYVRVGMQLLECPVWSCLETAALAGRQTGDNKVVKVKSSGCLKRPPAFMGKGKKPTST